VIVFGRKRNRDAAFKVFPSGSPKCEWKNCSILIFFICFFWATCKKMFNEFFWEFGQIEIVEPSSIFQSVQMDIEFIGTRTCTTQDIMDKNVTFFPTSPWVLLFYQRDIFKQIAVAGVNAMQKKFNLKTLFFSCRISLFKEGVYSLI